MNGSALGPFTAHGLPDTALLAGHVRATLAQQRMPYNGKSARPTKLAPETNFISLLLGERQTADEIFGPGGIARWQAGRQAGKRAGRKPTQPRARPPRSLGPPERKKTRLADDAFGAAAVAAAAAAVAVHDDNVRRR